MTDVCEGLGPSRWVVRSLVQPRYDLHSFWALEQGP